MWRCLGTFLIVLNSAHTSAFNQEKAKVGAFFVIVKTDGSFAALVHSVQVQIQTPS